MLGAGEKRDMEKKKFFFSLPLPQREISFPCAAALANPSRIKVARGENGFRGQRIPSRGGVGGNWNIAVEKENETS